MKKKKTCWKKDFQKAFQNKKDLEVVPQKSIEDFKKKELQRDEAISHLLVEINKYKRITVQTLQSQVQDSVKIKKHIRKHKVKLKASPNLSTGPEAHPENNIPLPIWQTFEVQLNNECIAKIRCEG